MASTSGLMAVYFNRKSWDMIALLVSVDASQAYAISTSDCCGRSKINH
jgi:hypothetical protein